MRRHPAFYVPVALRAKARRWPNSLQWRSGMATLRQLGLHVAALLLIEFGVLTIGGLAKLFHYLFPRLGSYIQFIELGVLWAGWAVFCIFGSYVAVELATYFVHLIKSGRKESREKVRL